jgi:curved DNA-binding protein CbpA
MRDHYDELGVSPDSEQEVIQAAYRALMRKYHPDINRSPAAAVRAQKLNEAYDVLGDSEKRAAYDRAREEENPSDGDDDAAETEEFPAPVTDTTQVAGAAGRTYVRNAMVFAPAVALFLMGLSYQLSSPSTEAAADSSPQQTLVGVSTADAGTTVSEQTSDFSSTPTEPSSAPVRDSSEPSVLDARSDNLVAAEADPPELDRYEESQKADELRRAAMERCAAAYDKVYKEYKAWQESVRETYTAGDDPWREAAVKQAAIEKAKCLEELPPY